MGTPGSESGGGGSAPAAPDDDRLAGVRSAQHGQLVGRAVGALGRAAQRLPERLAGRAELGEELLVALCEGGEAVLQVEDPAYALDADPRGGELGDLAEPVDVAGGVAAAAAPRAPPGGQAQPPVGGPGLGGAPPPLRGGA